MSKKKQAEEMEALQAQQQAEAAAQAEAEAKAAKIEADKHRTQIPAGVVMQGNFVAGEDMFVAGKIEGDVECQNLCILAGGKHVGKAKVENLDLAGDMQSEIECCGTARIASGGVVLGKITSKVLNAEPGAAIQGEVKIGAAAPSKPASEEPKESPEASDTDSDLKAMGFEF